MLNYRSYQNKRNPQSLHAVATNAIVSELGRVAGGINRRFTCGGKYEVPSTNCKPIKLVYRQAGHVCSKVWSSVEFPGVSETDMIKLLDVCSVESYGHMGKDAVDEAYQNAFKLEPDNFLTSFQICATPILQEIQSIVSTVVGLKAELYKLNYKAGQHHIETSIEPYMTASLNTLTWWLF